MPAPTGRLGSLPAVCYVSATAAGQRALNKVTVPFLDIPLGSFLVAQGTAVIFCAALVLMAKISSAAGATR